MVRLPFRNRSDAGRALAAEIVGRKLPANTIVLALVRGGLPVGQEVAAALHAPLDIVVVRKLGVPWQPELAIGAIAGAARFLDHRLVRELGISSEQIAQIVDRETKEMERREELYRGGLAAPALSGRTVILVDDGLATGSTMTAAARYVRTFHPRKLIIAVPVGSASACAELARESDECICLATPEPFYAVGAWYFDFNQVSDDDVREILKRSHSSAASVA